MGFFNEKETLRYDASGLEKDLLRPGEWALQDMPRPAGRPGAEPTGSWIPRLEELRTLGPKPVMEVAKILNDRRHRAGKLTAEEVRFANERLAGLREKEFWRTVLDESLYGFVALCVAVTLGLGALAGPLVGLGVGGWLFWHPFRTGSADEAED